MPITRKVYEAIASAIEARKNCETSGNTEWFAKHEAKALDLTSEYLPSGSGVDSGTQLDVSASNPEKLVFHLEYHHMEDNGYYDGWTSHTVTVRPSLAHGITLSISGRNRNDIKDYLGEILHEALTRNIEILTFGEERASSAPTDYDAETFAENWQPKTEE